MKAETSHQHVSMPAIVFPSSHALANAFSGWQACPRELPVTNAKFRHDSAKFWPQTFIWINFDLCEKKGPSRIFVELAEKKIKIKKVCGKKGSKGIFLWPCGKMEFFMKKSWKESELTLWKRRRGPSGFLFSGKKRVQVEFSFELAEKKKKLRKKRVQGGVFLWPCRKTQSCGKKKGSKSNFLWPCRKKKKNKGCPPKLKRKFPWWISFDFLQGGGGESKAEKKVSWLCGREEEVQVDLCFAGKKRVQVEFFFMNSQKKKKKKGGVPLGPFFFELAEKKKVAKKKGSTCNVTWNNFWLCANFTVHCYFQGEKGEHLFHSENHCTQDSRVVPHHGTNWAALWLTLQIGRDAVLSESYGRGW
jgi:hypothetical protein